MSKKISLQLYSIRDFTEKDFLGTLKKVAQMGYKGVEFAGYGNISAKDMNIELKNLGLDAVSAHVSLDALQNNLDQEIEYLLAVGAKHITCPYADMDTKEKALQYAEILAKIGEKTANAGLTLSYHNHAHEFKLDNGEYPLEVFFANTGGYVKQEPDLYWVQYAGVDPMDYLKKHIDRCPLIHLKQMQDIESKENTNAGSGIIDFPAVMGLATNAEFIYEQEHYIGTSLEEVEKSVQFLLSV